MNDWTKTLDKQEQTDIVYLDFAKAFDTVSHPKLLAKLEAMGIIGLSLGWIKAFLSDRSQFVCVEGQTSEVAPVTSGVPQGCVLSPVYFISYANDLLLKLRFSKGKLFADDAKIYLSRDSINSSAHLQEDLNAVSEWANEWQMNLSIGKCAVLHASRNPIITQYTIDNNALNVSMHTKDLGIYVSSNLKPSYHCQKIVFDALRISSCIYRNFMVKNAEFLRQMFITFVRPKVEYATVIWSPWYKKDINLIERVQKSFTSKIPGINGSYTRRLATLNLQSLELRRKIFDLIEVFKILRGFSPLKANEFFQLSQSYTRGHNLRLIKERFYCDERKYFFSNRVFEIWNKLPQETVNAPSISAFKRLIIANDTMRNFLKGDFL
jgi:hypothetical protein